MGCNQSHKNGDLNLKFDKFNIPNYKIALIGDPNVGKTSIFLRYAKNQFDFNYKPTQRAVVENIVKKVNLPASVISSVTLWDLPGHEDMDLRESYYRNVDAVIVVVDMTDEASIELAGAWKQNFMNRATRVKLVKEKLPSGLEVSKMEELPFNPLKVPVLLLGNKYDLVEENLTAERLKKELAEEKVEEKAALDDMVNDIMGPLEGSEKGGDKTTDDTKNLKEVTSNKTSPDIPESERPFTPQKGPEEDEVKPQCVKLLESVQQEYGFIGSIMVSAKDNDESVTAAIQSLVRHMMEKQGILKQKIKKEKKKKRAKKKVVADDGFRSLKEVGIKEYDRLFERCTLSLRRAFDYGTFHDLALKKFKQTCADYGFLTESKASLEDCIVAIRDAIKNDTNMDLEVEDDEEGFVKLFHDVNPQKKTSREIMMCLEAFHEEYATVCKVILRDCPALDTMLNKYDVKISTKTDNTWELMGSKQSGDVERVNDICDQNRARIAFARKQLSELIEKVESAEKKIKAALIW